MSDQSAQRLVHRYMPGIRFDGLWEYQVANSSGELRWSFLPMDEGDAGRDDPDGLGWCLCKCIAVTTQRPLLKVVDVERLLAHLMDMGDWKATQAGYEVVHVKKSAEITMDSVARLLEEGGCVLMKIEKRGKKRQPEKVEATWVWVVGVEFQIAPQDPLPKDGTVNSVVRSLLTVWKTNAPPWASGYGARLSLLKEEECLMSSTDGHWLQGRCMEALFLVPMDRTDAK